MSRTVLALFAALALVSEAFAQIDTTFTVYGPRRFERSSGTPVTVTENFMIPSTASSPYTLYLINGDWDGTERVSSATVTVNGVVVIDQNDLNQQVAYLLRSVTLTTNNTIDVRLSSQPKSYIIIGITATDLTAPRLTVTSPAEGFITNASSITVSGTVLDETVTTLSVNGFATTIGSGGAFSQQVTLAEGINTITIVATDARSNSSTVTRDVRRDSQPPTLIVLTPTEAFITNQTPISVSGSVADSTQTAVTVNGTALSVGSNGTFSGQVTLIEGVNILTFVATDQAGNSTTVVRNGRLDTQAPVLTLSSPPEGLITNLVNTTISGTVTDASTIALKINNTDVTVQTDGSFSTSIQLSEGMNNVAVTATDAAGNSSAATRQVRLDTQPPVLVVSQPSSQVTTNQTTYDIIGNVSDSTATTVTVNGIQVTITAGQFTTQINLAEGLNTVTVVATDAASNTSTVTREIIRDTTPPALIVSQPAGDVVTKEAAYAVTGNVTDSTALTVTINGTPVSPGTNGDFTFNAVLVEGSNTILIIATDAVGNTSSVSRKIVRDSTPPTLTVTSPSTGMVTTANTVTVNGTVFDSTAVTITANGTPLPVNGDGSFTGQVPIMEGTNVITVVATDAVGNTSTITQSVIRDTAPPVLTLSTPSDNTVTRDTSAAVSGTVTDSTSITLLVNGAPVTPGPTGSFTTSVPLTEGVNTVTVSATDAAGNSITVTRSIFRDTTPPALTPTSPGSGTITNQTSINVGGTVSDASAVTVTANGTPLSVVGGAFSGSVPLTEGLNTISIVATDTVGNSSTQILTVRRDTAPPMLTVAQPADSLITSQSTVTVQGTVIDSTTISLKVNGSVVTVGSDGSWTTQVTLVEGFNTITIEATDAATNVSTIVRHVQRSSLPPVLTILSPMDEAVISSDSVLVSGRITSTSTVTLTINGTPKSVNTDGTFAHKMLITEGKNHFVLIATDALGQKDTSEVSVVRDTKQPAISIISPAFTPYTTDSTIVIIGSVVDSSGTTVAVNGVYQQLSGIGGFETQLNLVFGVNTFTIQATDLAGNTTTVVRTIQRVQKVSDPATIAPVVDRTVTTTVASATEFLYTGSNAVQKNVAAGTINALRVTALRGKVMTQQGIPLGGVTVKVVNHTEYGFTLSREDGMYDLAVNGGGVITLDYARPGFLPAQRTVNAEWQTYGHVDDVSLVAMDTLVQHVDFTAPQGVQATPVADELGTRRPTVFFPQGTVASLVFPTFSYRTIPGCTGVSPKVLSTPVDSLVAINGITVRVQEYSVGTDGERALPAPLPSTVAYSFAFELQADEVISRGAARAQLSQPATLLLENVINFPEGMSIPLGYYDRTNAAWLPSDNGQVIRIVGKDTGYARIDWNGDGVAEHPDTLVLRGISYAEQRYLAATYSSNQSLLRMKFSKLGSYTIGFGFVLPTNAKAPTNPAPDRYAKVDRDNIVAGSVIGVQNQMLGESIPITNTTMSLHYRSDRVEGRREAYMLDIPLTGSPAPDSCLRVEVEVEVCGQVVRQTYTPQANLKFQFEWDGKDVYGRKLQGQQNVLTTISFYYATRYAIPADWSKSFATPTGRNMIRYIPSRKEMAKTQIWEGKIGAFDVLSLGIGGWSISQHHGYDVLGRILYTGDGQVRSARVMDNVITTLAGISSAQQNQVCNAQYTQTLPALQIPMGTLGSFCFTADGSILLNENYWLMRKLDTTGMISTLAGFYAVCRSGGYSDTTAGVLAQCANIYSFGLREGSDKSVYLTASTKEHIFRITPDGEIKHFAGVFYNTGGSGYGCFADGDGGPALQAHLGRTGDMAFGKDGSLYFADMFNHRIRKVSRDGIITTVAGSSKNYNENGYSGDGGPAINAKMYEPRGFTMGPDGSLYICDYRNHRIRKVTPDGIINTIAGTGVQGSTGDGGLAIYARTNYPYSITIGDDGTVYFCETGGKVRAISTDGYIKTVVGGGNTTWMESGPATAAQVGPAYTAFGQDGCLYVTDNPGPYIPSRLFRVGPPLPGLKLSEILVASEDGSEQYVFTYGGRHLRTLDALTGVTKYTFNYDPQFRLVSIVDVDSLITTIERNTSGVATAIISPYGVRTELALDANGYLLAATNPANEARQFTYTSKGLMTSMTDARGSMYTYTYDSLGYLTKDLDPVGGFTAITRAYDSTGYTVTATTAMGKVTKYRTDQLRDGSKQFATTDPNGLKTITSDATNGTATSTASSGMSAPTQQKPDPRYGMQSPLSNLTVQTPGGLQSNVNQFRKVTQMSGTQVTGLTDSVLVNGKVFKTQWDGVARRLTKTSPEGRKTFTFFDAKGKVTKDSTSGLIATTYAYDSKGRRIEARQDGRVTRFEYDVLGRQWRVTDPYGRSTYFYYDGADRMVRTVAPDGSEVQFAYDRNGNATAITPPGKPEHTFDYSLIDLETLYAPPFAGDSSRSTARTYTLDKEALQILRPDSLNITLQYGGTGSLAGQPKRIYFDRGVITNLYDTTKALQIGVIAPTGDSLRYLYDGTMLKRITWSGPNGLNSVKGGVGFTYNTDMQVGTETVYPAAGGADSVNLKYDKDGLMTSVGALKLRYDAGNNLLLSDTLGGVITNYTYSTFGELASKEVKYGAATLFRLDYSRDSLGRITQEVETQQGISQKSNYAYDLVGRLHRVWRNDTLASTYDYDANGNRLAKTTPAGVDSGRYDSQDRLLSYGNASYVYSQNGDLRLKVEGTDTTRYAYDAFGSLVSVTLPSGTLIEYLLDGNGLRIGRKVNGAVTQKWIYSNNLRIAAETDSANNVTSRFVYTTSENAPEYVIKGGVVYRIVTDHLGSVKLVLNTQTGEVVQSVGHDEFGNVVLDTNPGFVPFGFAGGVHDLQTRLVRFGARDFDARSGRWDAKDPSRFDGSDGNLFRYCDADPVNSIDKAGKNAELVIALFEMAINSLAMSTDPKMVRGLDEKDFVNYAKHMILAAGVFAAAGFAVAILSSNDPTPVGQLIPGKLKRSPSYHSELADKSVSELKQLQKQGGDAARRAKQMLKLVKDQKRLIQRDF